MYTDIEAKVLHFIEKENMLQHGDHVVAGISGGADSVCLLFLLCAFREAFGLDIDVVHVNHGIRTDAQHDADYVEKLCRDLDISFNQVNADIPRMAREKHLSEEEAGRIARYQAFRDKCHEHSKIAVAHTANDNAETMLFNLFRGSGLKGISGISPCRDNIIRPILCLNREEVEAYLIEKNVEWCTDSTNLEDEYTRNRIRHHIIPEAEAISAESIAHMQNTAQLLRETDDFMEIVTDEVIGECVTSRMDNKIELLISRLLDQHSAIQKRVIKRLLSELAGSAKDLELTHTRMVLELASKVGNGCLNLPYEIEAEKSYDKLTLSKAGRDMLRETDKYTLSATGSIATGGDNGKQKGSLSLTCISREDFLRQFPKGQVPNHPYTKYFDYDKICRDFDFQGDLALENMLEIRSREPGDYIELSDGGGGICRKSLKDYMVNEKIPQKDRSSIPILAVGNRKAVLWIVGYRISETYKVSEMTQQILRVDYLEEVCQNV